MKIKVKLEVSEIGTKYITLDIIGDLEISQKDWGKMTDEQRLNIINNEYVFNANLEQPYWYAKSFKEIETL